jgi:hypothetical protein
MYKLLPAFVVLLVLCALPASACETCRSYFDYQTLTYCKYCDYSYCGYFQCVVRESGWGYDYCDSAWDVDGDDQCFTDGGVSKARCGPQYQPMLTASAVPIPKGEWRLVRVRIENGATKARGNRRRS